MEKYEENCIEWCNYGKCVDGGGVSANNLPIFRGNKSVVEVASVDTNPTKLPEVEALQAGTVSTATRCFDLLCLGKYTSESGVNLNIQSTGETPNLITKNSDGEVVFAEPKPMCTIQAPKGHNVWVNIELKTITTNAPDHMCLGIKKRSEDEYFYLLHTGDSSRYVDVQEDDVVELVPLVSSTLLSTGYTAVNPGDTAKITSENTYDFGSVFRVNITLSNARWLTNQSCDLSKLGAGWSNYGKVGVGSVTDSYGTVHENQFVAVGYSNGISAYSSDGIHWNKTEGSIENNAFRDPGIVYGNGIWCTIACSDANVGVQRSLDGIKTWSGTLARISAHALHFGNDIFMTIDNSGIVYTSPDAEVWTQIGSIGIKSLSSMLIYGDGKWISGGYSSYNGYIYWSKDGTGIWTRLDDGSLCSISTSAWYGGCYVNGYFYVINSSGLIARSPTGKTWKRVFNIGSSGYYNISYRDNKLWAFNSDGSKYVVGLFNPDGTIDIES